MRIISSQITFRRESLIKNNIKFDENFGAGAKYNRAEETIMLCDAINKKLKIKYINKKIGIVKQEESTWFGEIDKKFLIIQGTCFARMAPKIYELLILQYAIRKYKLYKKNVKLMEAIKLMNQGAKEYQK